MAFHPLGSARMDARPSHGVLDGDGRVHGDGGRLRLRRQRDPLVARRQPPDHDHDPRDPIGGSPMSFLIDPPWLYANGRALARTSRPAAARGVAARWPFLGREHPALPQPALDEAGVARCAAPTSGRDWMLNSGVLKLDHRRPSTPHPRRQRGDLRDLPAVAVPRLPARAAMSAPRFPAVALHRGHYESYYLRAADPASGRSAWIRHTVFKRPRRPGDRRAVVHAVRRRPARAARGQAVAARPARRRLARARPEPHRARRRAAAAPRRRAAARPGSSPSARASEPLRHLPHPKLYDAPLPRTKTESPLPDTAISGWVEADGERWELDALARDGRPQLGRRARRALDLAARRRLRRRARRVARRRARPHPHRPADHALDRQRRPAPRRRAHPPRRPRAAARASTSAPTAASIEVSGVRIEVRAAPLVSWVYSDPSGGEHRSTNCSIAARRADPRGPGAAHRPRRRVGARDARGAAGRGGSAVPGSVTNFNCALRGRVRGGAAAREARCAPLMANYCDQGSTPGQKERRGTSHPLPPSRS